MNAATDAAVRKVFRRLVPLCMVFYVLSYMDRINIGFAALTMNKDLGLTATVYGFAGTAFYVMYAVFEVPSNLALARFGARIWIPRIMITWGIASIATMFAVGPKSLSVFRALVGAAEAGLLPGIVYYLSQWFPKVHRARANGIFFAALPLALLFGAPLSGLILQLDGIFGIAGWRWLFLLEGLPSVLMGVAVFFILPNGPEDAPWLETEEKAALQSRLAEELRAQHPHSEHTHSRWSDVRSLAVAVLGLTYFCLLNTVTTFSVWTPLIVKDVLGGTDRILLVSFISAIPPLFAIGAMQLVSRSSDRKDERLKHLIGSLLAAAGGWILVAGFDVAAVRLIGLTVCFSGTYSALAIFWATAAQLIPRRSHAIGIALVSTVGSIASIISPAITGILRDLTHSFNAGAWYAVVLLAAGIALMAALGRVQRRAAMTAGRS